MTQQIVPLQEAEELSYQASCRFCLRTGASKRRCKGCGRIWCTKCRTGKALETLLCPVCGCEESVGQVQPAAVLAPSPDTRDPLHGTHGAEREETNLTPQRTI